jgi:hypothetical protein
MFTECIYLFFTAITLDTSFAELAILVNISCYIVTETTRIYFFDMLASL